MVQEKVYFIHKYTWMSGVGGQWALMDCVVSDNYEKERLLYVSMLRRAANGMSDHFLLEVKVKGSDGFRERGNDVCKRSGEGEQTWKSSLCVEVPGEIE